MLTTTPALDTSSATTRRFDARAIVRGIALGVTVVTAFFFLSQTLLSWFVAREIATFSGPFGILIFVPPLALVFLLMAAIVVLFTRPRGRHRAILAACTAISLACLLMWSEVSDLGARLYFSTHEADFAEAAETARRGGAPIGRWLRTEVTADYVAFDMGGFWDNRHGVVHVAGAMPPILSEFGGGFQLVRLDPIGDGWYLYWTT